MAERDTSKTKVVRDWVNRPPAKPTGADVEARRKLWEALSAYVSGEGGWVVSLPGAQSLRIECRQGSDLPIKLRALNYSVRAVGAGTRIGTTTETITAHSTRAPIIRHHSGIFPVDVIEISLGG
jgi:hypothetical protein